MPIPTLLLVRSAKPHYLRSTRYLPRYSSVRFYPIIFTLSATCHLPSATTKKKTLPVVTSSPGPSTNFFAFVRRERRPTNLNLIDLRQQDLSFFFLALPTTFYNTLVDYLPLPLPRLLLPLHPFLIPNCYPLHPPPIFIHRSRIRQREKKRRRKRREKTSTMAEPIKNRRPDVPAP